MSRLFRAASYVAIVWYLGGYLFDTMMTFYPTGSGAAPFGYVIALFVAAVVDDTVFKGANGNLASGSDMKRGALIVAGGVVAALILGRPLTAWAYATAPWLALPPPWPGWVIGYTAGALVVAIVTAGGSRSAGGIRLGHGWDLVLRPVKGFFFILTLDIACLMLSALAAGFIVADVMSATLSPLLRWMNLDRDLRENVLLVVYAFVVIIPVMGFWMDKTDLSVIAPVLRFLGRITAPIRTISRRLQFGKGGEAAFGGMFEEFAHIHRDGEILLGASSYSRKLRIGLESDTHLLTFASTGGGKGRSVIIPNLLLWRHSALVIDPKGTNAAVTARARGYGGGGLKQEVFVIDPFDQMKDQGVDIETAFYNPLLDIDPDSNRYYEDLRAVAEGLVIPSGDPNSKDTFWDDKTRDMIAGFIEFVIDKESPALRTLGQVRTLMIGQDEESFGRLLKRMIAEGRPDGMAQAAATDLMRLLDTNTYENIRTTIGQHLSWLTSKPMQKILSSSDFSMKDLQEKPTSVYLVLPPEELDTHYRFLRLFVSIGLRAVFRRAELQEGDAPKRRVPVLFVLDEFLALGRINAMIRAVNVGRSYGLKVWPICQNVDGLLDVYGKNGAQNFIDTAGAIQVFSVGNLTSAQWLSSYIGVRDILRPTADGQYSVVSGVALRSGLEVQAETERDTNKQIIIRHGKRPLYLNRYPYDKYFPPGSYDPDPDHRQS